ncbi:MAG: DUF5939 domain-containing protein [Verrucomicrobiota bacterium]
MNLDFDRTMLASMPAVVRIESQHEVPFPRAKIWPILSKTDWINRAIGLPPVQYDIQSKREGGSRVTARARLFGMELVWQELPFEWVEPEFYRVRRIFQNGFLREANLGLDFVETQDGNTRVRVISELTPRHALGGWIARKLLSPKSTRDMAEVIKHAAAFLKGQQPAVLPRLPKQPVDEAALEAGLGKLKTFGESPFLIQKIECLLRNASDVELTHIRPFAAARAWNYDRWHVLRLFLAATRAGLLDLSWEILCPNCRSSRAESARSLRDLSRTAHCDVCQIKYDAQFDKSVELKFAVNPAIRARDQQTFCLAGPGGKPHVVSQIYLEPGQRRSWKLPDFTRPYRMRSPQVKEPVVLNPEPGIETVFQAVVMCHPERFDVCFEYGKTQDFNLQILNPNSFPVQVVLERQEWDEDILTASRVTGWQEFRDLFTSEVISPTEQITVGSQIVLFTDLRGSTAMYNGIGDAPAYSVVRNHFAVLVEAVRSHHGAVVKTIGDAVMAVFNRVDEALGAVAQMHFELPKANVTGTVQASLALKSSLHIGPCLAVNANDKLDFFGTTINLAARLVDCCKGGDLTISDDMFQRPETQAFLTSEKLAAEPAEVKFRGFEHPHKVWRIKILKD